MGAERNRFTLGELCSLITDGKHGDCEDEGDSGFYFLSVKDVLDNRLVYGKARQITKKDFQETHRRTNLEPGDVLFTNTGTIGRMAIAPNDPRTFRTTFQKSVAILKPKRDLIYPHFLYYLLHFDNARLSEFAAGTTQKNLLLKDLRSFTVDVPGLAEQRRITAILGALDDKIELNRKMSRTLEEMAQAIFKSWFVDFDGHDDLVDSELGPIPRGWEVRTVGTLLELAYGKSLPAETRILGKVAVYGSGGLSGWHNQSLVTGPGIVVGRKGTIGTVYWVDNDFFPIDTTFYIRLRDSALSLRWAYLRLSEMDIARLGADSAVPGVNRNAVYAQMWCVPPRDVVANFEKIVTPLMAKMQANRLESDTLAELRDALLPKLISGEVRVSSSTMEKCA